MSWRADEVKPQMATPNKERCKNCQLELRPVLLGSPSTVVTPAVHPAARHNIDISILRVLLEEIRRKKSGLEIGDPCSIRTRGRGSS